MIILNSESIITLDEVNLDNKCIVQNIKQTYDTDKLMNLGVISGTQITPLFISPFGGIRAYLVKGSVLAMRDEQAKNIEVKI